MTKCNIRDSGKQFCCGYCVSFMLVVSFMDAGKSISNFRFPHLFIHVKASQAAGKGILDSTRNWSHHQNLGIRIKVPSLAGFEVLKTSKVLPLFWQLTITYPCAPHQYTCFMWKLHECSSTTFTCLCSSLAFLLEEKNLCLKIQQR